MKRFLSVGECMIEMAGGEDAVYRQGFAGDTLNTAWYARAALGDDWAVDYFTATGDDIYSDRMLTFLSGHAIGTSRIRRLSGKRPGLYIIHQADGDRHFTYWRDNSAATLLADDPAALDAALEGADLIYFSGITLAILPPEARSRLLGAIGAARQAGARTAFDPNIRPVLWPEIAELRTAMTHAAGVADFVLPTFGDEQPVFGDRTPEETAMRYLQAGAGEVVVKNGGEDALVIGPEGRARAAAIRDPKIVDATGAGDSFNGAYLAARLVGMDAASAAKAAHRMAAIVIGHPGALIAPALVA